MGCVLAGSRYSLYWVFAYFSFIIGKTTQTADITVTSLRMRLQVLFNSFLPFIFGGGLIQGDVVIIDDDFNSRVVHAD